MDELGDGLEDVGIEIDVEFLYTRSYVRFSGELKSLGVGNSACRWFLKLKSLSDCTLGLFNIQVTK